MHIDFLLAQFNTHRSSDAIVWRDRVYTYEWLTAAVKRWQGWLESHGVDDAQVVSLETDFSPNAVALLLALIERNCTLVPLCAMSAGRSDECCRIAEVQTRIQIDAADNHTIAATGVTPTHPLLTGLQDRRRPGLVLFSSGSTGEPKAVLHDLVPMLDKYRTPRHQLRAITFLLFDHIGGFNTLIYNLANGGCVVTVSDRRPESVCAAIEAHRVQLLPTSPTFLNLLLAGQAWRNHDISSLETVTYGTEPMPATTLARFHALFPGIRMLQTYGLSEVGILRSKSKASDSLWVKIGGEGFETRVVDGMLEIRARSAMLGYLNAPSPFTADGWMRTGDEVEVDGEYFRILGRRSEIINVGGEKVFPTEVEGILQQMPGVEDVTVAGQPNPITGQVVAAQIKLQDDETLPDFRRRMHAYCRDRLARHKIPQKVEIVSSALHGQRYKKIRKA